MSGISAKDLFNDARLRGPGLIESLMGSLLGLSLPLDCVQIEVTSACPGKCAYCPHTTAKNWQTRFLAPETFARLWPLLRKSSRAHLQGWGEPLLHPDFFEFAALARKAGCEVSTTTCGLAMKEDTAQKIARSGMDAIAFSLVGTDQDSNAARAGVDFSTVRESILCLRKTIDRIGHGPEIRLAYLMLADRVEAVEKLPELMQELGVGTTVVSTLDYLAAPEHGHWAFAPGEREKIEAARSVLRAAAQRAAEKGLNLAYALPAEKPHGQCRENVARTLYVDAGGNISPCVYRNVPDAEAPARISFGNVLEQDPWHIWNLPSFVAYRANAGQESCPPECSACPKRYEEEMESGYAPGHAQ